MSLRWVHVFFISVSIALSLYFAWWNALEYRQSSSSVHALGAGLSVLAALALAGYLVWYLGKIRRIP